MNIDAIILSFYFSISIGHNDVAALLMENHVNTKAVNKNQKTACDLARDNGRVFCSNTSNFIFLITSKFYDFFRP